MDALNSPLLRGLTIGAIIGTAAVLLLSPFSGRELRERVAASLGGWHEPVTGEERVFAPPSPKDPILATGDVRPDLVGDTSCLV